MRPAAATAFARSSRTMARWVSRYEKYSSTRLAAISTPPTRTKSTTTYLRNRRPRRAGPVIGGRRPLGA